MNASTAIAVAPESQMFEPIVVKLQVGCPPDRAFDYFTRDITRWWPLDDHSCSDSNADDLPASVAFEPRVGGGLVETSKAGLKHRWGTVSAWAPGARVAFSWHPGRPEATAQRVEVTFAPNAAGTLVTLTHGGWDPADPATEKMHRSYSGGWQFVFGECYAGYCANS